MRTVGVFCPVWREHRYLPLILEQMALCPGPSLVYWQDKPWYWTQPGEPPSGHKSKVETVLERSGIDTTSKIFVHLVNQSPSETDTVNHCVQLLKEKGAQTFIRLDSDYIFTLDAMRRIYTTLAESEIDLWGCLAWHYWRDWEHAIGTPSMGLTTLGWPPAPCEAMLDVTCYHPSYIHTDAEMVEKTSSWGHAPLFSERKFLEKEWFPKNDAVVTPFQCPRPPGEIAVRLERAGALL